MRLIVSYVSSSTYKLCKYPANWFMTNSNLCSSYSVKNSTELIDHIKDLSVPPNSILISCDVSSMYTCFPLGPTIQHVTDILEKSGLIQPIIDEFLNLLNVCIDHNICKFDNNLYSFQDGLPMGSPLAPQMAEIFMNAFEKRIFTFYYPIVTSIQYWFRYVDDVLCLWTGPHKILQNFLSFINSLYRTTKFTLEVGGQHINFFDSPR